MNFYLVALIHSYERTPNKEGLLSALPTLGEASLNILKTWPLADVRRAALRELQRHGLALNEQERADLVEPPQSFLTALARAPVKSEAAESDDERYARISKEDATAFAPINWYSIDDAFRYRVLVEHGLIARESVRQDVSEGFRPVRKDTDERLSAQFGAEPFAQLREAFAPYEGTISRIYTEQAFLALSLNPTPEDLPLARQHLTNKAEGTGPIRIVAQCGDESDVGALIEIARSSSQEDRTMALDGIKKLASDHIRVAKELLGASGHHELQRLGVFFIRQSPDNVAMPLLEELLSHGDDAIRAASVSELQARFSRDQLTDILAAYTKRPSYYYNVVTWLDRLLYAPEPLCSYYREELHRNIKGLAG